LEYAEELWRLPQFFFVYKRERQYNNTFPLKKYEREHFQSQRVHFDFAWVHTFTLAMVFLFIVVESL